MRVSKLAKEIGCVEGDLLGLIHRLGYPRYTGGEQQLPAEVVERVHRHARELEKKPPAPPKVQPGPVRRLDAGDDPETRRLLEAEMRGVRVLTALANRPPRVAAARPVPAGIVRPDREARPAAPAGIGAAAPEAPRSVVPDPRVAELERTLGRVEWERRDLADRLARAEADRDAGAARLTANASGRTLRDLLLARGLVSDGEFDFFFSAVGGGHRSSDLVDLLFSASPLIERWLSERVILVGPDDEVPPGMVGVRVPVGRSEGAASPAIRAALTRLSTTLLVHGKRRLAVLGGPPAALRVLREGLDRRIEVRVAVGPVAGALLVEWGDGATPGAVPVHGRDVVAFCTEVVEHLER